MRKEINLREGGFGVFTSEYRYIQRAVEEGFQGGRAEITTSLSVKLALEVKVK